MTTPEDLSTAERPTNELLALRRACAAVLAGTLALTLVGCRENLGQRGGSSEAGTIEETRDRVSDTEIAECLADTPYTLEGDGAHWSGERYGEYHKGRTNAVIEITPEAGGETLLIEQTLNVFSRPQDLVYSPLTNLDIVEPLGCGPADLPRGIEENYIKYNVKKNNKALELHSLTS